MAGGIDKIREIAERVAQSNGLELVDVELLGGGKARMLRIFIDKPEGVTHEDCSNFSREVGIIFDVEEAVPGGAYTLEVSSPGLDRPLKKLADYERFAGREASVKLKLPRDGQRRFEGRLAGVEDGKIVLDVEGKRHELAIDDIDRARLVPDV